MHELLHNIRFYILVLSVITSLTINAYVLLTTPAGSLQTIRLNQIYGLISFVLLYLALLAGPFCYMFSNFAWKNQYLKARRAIGVSAFYFAALHAIIAFFGQLNGFEGLAFLTTNYQIALGVSAVALFILLLQAMTSFDAVIEWMTFPRWKILQRFVYLAGVLTLVHVVMLGTHFQDLTSPIARVAYIALAFLFFLEAMRIDSWFKQLFRIEPKLGLGSVLIGGALITIGVLMFTPIASQSTVSLGIHPKHSVQTPEQNTALSKSMLASMEGDRSLRYTVSFDKPQTMQPNQNAVLQFDVFNAANGNEVNLFQKVYEKEAHLIIVDNELQYFSHIHPQREGNTFTIATQFPRPGVYRAYLSYQPVGAVEQQVAFSFQVGQGWAARPANAAQNSDTNMIKTFGQYEVTLSTGNGLVAKEMENATQKLSFMIRDAVSKKQVTNLQPYLGAFGHLVMINTKDYSYIHVHPEGEDPQPNQNGGPEIAFVPMTIADPIKPGVYKVFAEFNPNGQLFVADYTVEVQ
jgi:DMSO/TMAO reductase YedYZ heme-binding membrane subunit